MRLSLLVLLVPLMLTACSGFRPTNAPPEDDAPVSIFTGKPSGTNLSDILGGGADGGEGLPVNAILWRAALDISALVVIEDVDVFSGTILTAWHSTPSAPNRRIRLAVFVVGRELRSDGIRVVTYAQERESAEAEWNPVFRDEQFSRLVENLVLNRAREIRAATVTEVNN